jgi:hypothetical protein
MNEESTHSLSNSTEKDDTNVNLTNTSNVSLTDNSPAGKRENTRSEIAKIYVYAFFITIAVAFAIGLYNSFALKEYIDFLIAVSGVLSGPLGFIIGYYFKTANDNK